MCDSKNISIVDQVQQAAISSAYELVKQHLDEYLHAHARRGAVAEQIDGEIGAAARARYLPPLGLEVTTGVGKSFAAAVLAAAAQLLGLPVLILVPTLALADDYVSAIAAAGGHAVRYVARQSPEAVAADPELHPWASATLSLRRT